MQGLTFKKKKNSCTLVFGFAAFSALANHCVLPASSRSTHRYWQDNCLNIWCNNLPLLNSLTNNNKKLYFLYAIKYLLKISAKEWFQGTECSLEGCSNKDLLGWQLGSFLCLCLDAFHVFTYRIHFRLGLSSGFFCPPGPWAGLVLMMENEKCFFL